MHSRLLHHLLTYMACLVVVTQHGAAQEETVAISPTRVSEMQSSAVKLNSDGDEIIILPSVTSSVYQQSESAVEAIATTVIVGTQFLTVGSLAPSIAVVESSASNIQRGSSERPSDEQSSFMVTPSAVIDATTFMMSSASGFVSLSASGDQLVPSSTFASLRVSQTLNSQFGNVNSSQVNADAQQSTVLFTSVVDQTQVSAVPPSVSADFSIAPSATATVVLATSSAGANSSNTGSSTGSGGTVGDGSTDERRKEKDAEMDAGGEAAMAIIIVMVVVAVVIAGVVIYRKKSMTPRGLQAMMQGGVRYQTHNNTMSYQDEASNLLDQGNKPKSY